MSNPIVNASNISKCYKLGVINRRTFGDEMAYKWHKLRGRDPAEYIGKIGRRDSKSGSDFWALKDVSFEVEQGEVLGVIGGNGAGKSTLLKILTRVTEPTSGRAVIEGRVGSLLEVGTGFHPELTGRENVYMNGTILGMKRRGIDAKFDEIVDFSGVERFIDTPVKRYSSGMYVRLAFSVAAHLESEVLLVDEVLAVGDAAFQKKCLGKMGEISKVGRTILFVSHRMANVRALCTRSIWLDGGRVRMDGDTETVADAYQQANGLTGVPVPIAQRTDRTGDGHWQAENAEMNYDKSSCRWRFSMSYTSEQSEIFGPSVVLGVLREDTPDKCVVVLDSYCMNGLPERIPGKGTISVELPSDVAFAPGDYSCDLTCKTWDEKKSSYVFSDQVKRALVFSVSDSVIFGWRRLPITPGMTLMQQKWSVEKAMK